MSVGRRESRLDVMNHVPAPTPLMYVECDVPESQTLTGWRSAREREKARRSTRRGPLGLLRRRPR
jgi:hypothetical protein